MLLLVLVRAGQDSFAARLVAAVAGGGGEATLHVGQQAVAGHHAVGVAVLRTARLEGTLFLDQVALSVLASRMVFVEEGCSVGTGTSSFIDAQVVGFFAATTGCQEDRSYGQAEQVDAFHVGIQVGLLVPVFPGCHEALTPANQTLR